MLKVFNDFNHNIKFTIEKESNSKLSYLDTLIIRRNKKLVIDWYQKPTASGRIINYYSKQNKRIILNTAKNLIERILTISDKEFHLKNIKKIREILQYNDFPNKLISKLIYNFKNNNVIANQIREPKIYKSLIYIPEISERLEKAKIFDANKYTMTYKSYNTLNKLFSKPKDKLDKFEKSNVVYKIPCTGNKNEICNKFYIGTTKNKLKTRIAGHKSDQKYRDNIHISKTALSSHCAKFNHYPNFENVSILNTENNCKRRYMLEMLQIINTPIPHRINYKSDTDNIAQNYRNLVDKI